MSWGPDLWSVRCLSWYFDVIILFVTSTCLLGSNVHPFRFKTATVVWRVNSIFKTAGMAEHQLRMTPTGVCSGALTYLSFLAVGTSCGWFVVNGRALKAHAQIFLEVCSKRSDLRPVQSGCQ